MIKKRLKLRNKVYDAYCVLFILMLIVHLNISMTLDDVWFSQILDSNNLFNFLVQRYHEWSSRVFIEAALAIISHAPIIIWQIADSIIFTGIAWLLATLIRKNDVMISWMSCLLCLIYPFSQMSYAGYVAATLNYIWPGFFLLAAMYCIRRQLDENIKKYKWEYVVCFIFLLLGGNSEQGAAVLFGALLLVIGYYLFRKKKPPLSIFANITVITAELIYIIRCPGNAARKAIEISAYFPEYNSLNKIRILDIGATSAMYHYIFKTNIMFAVFASILAVVSWKYAKNVFEKMVSIVTIMISLCFSIFHDTFYLLFPNLAFLKDSLTTDGTWASKISIIPYAIYGITALSILYCFWMIGRDKWVHGYILLSILILGFGSRFMMCFSASIWVSNDRTFFLMYIAFIAATLFLFTFINSSKKQSILLYGTGICGICSYLNLLAAIL